MKTNVVEKIHAAFDDAENYLLLEAEKFDEKNSLSNEEKNHVEMMTSLGFANSKAVQELNEKRALLEKSESLATLVKHYKATYPFLKFLTEVQLDHICDKYNLIYAPVANYKEDVPPKNLKEIANAQKLKNEDTKKNLFVIDKESTRWYENDVTDEIKNWVCEQTWEHFPTSRDVRRIVAQQFPDHEDPDVASNVSAEEIKRDVLFIAAPKSHFDLNGLSKKGEKGFFKTILQKEPDDPIVFRYVRGGIQVLSKWGLEAEDSALTNPINN